MSNETTKKTVGVIFGSRSVEHDVSIVTAQQVMQALDARKYEVVPIYITRDGRWVSGPGLRDLNTFRSDDISEMMGIKEVIISPSTAHHGLIVSPVSGLFGRSQARAQRAMVLAVYRVADVMYVAGYGGKLCVPFAKPQPLHDVVRYVGD